MLRILMYTGTSLHMQANLRLFGSHKDACFIACQLASLSTTIYTLRRASHRCQALHPSSLEIVVGILDLEGLHLLQRRVVHRQNLTVNYVHMRRGWLHARIWSGVRADAWRVWIDAVAHPHFRLVSSPGGARKLFQLGRAELMAHDFRNRAVRAIQTP